jgi:methylmalonyl-CoA mutase C-terminal domain/subunit
MAGNRIKVLMAKLGIDGHDRGVKVISRWLRDAGMEVILLGSFQTTERIIQAASQEDVDVIGLSFLGGQHLVHTRKFVSKLKETGLDDIILLVGGAIPKPDIAKLKEMGVHEVFVTGSSMESIVSFINDNVKKAPA